MSEPSSTLLGQLADEFLRLHASGQGPTVAEFAARHPHLTETLEQVLPWLIVDMPEAGLPRIEGYRLLRVLGQGGMGVVYLARELRLYRLVALKMIAPARLTDRAIRERFLAEAHLTARLRHPHIVPLYAIGESEGGLYFTMPWIPQGNLGAWFHAAPRTPHEVARVVFTLASAMAYAHHQGVIHRDLKPSNVFMDEANQPLIADFGLGRLQGATTDQTALGVVLGTPAYMSPEQARGEPGAAPAADIYALGAILYEGVTGRPPFQSRQVMEVVRQVLVDDPIAPRRIDSSIPRDLETIALKCLAKSPTSRYPSAQALADDLGRFQAGEPIQARPAGAVRRALAWVRRRPVLSALVVAVGVTVVLTTALVVRSRYADELAEANAALRVREAERERLLEQQRSLIYAAGLARAQSAWQEGQLDETATFLSQCPVERRGWEWRWLNAQIQRGPEPVLRSLHGRMGDCCFLDNGARLITIGMPDNDAKQAHLEWWTLPAGKQTQHFLLPWPGGQAARLALRHPPVKATGRLRPSEGLLLAPEARVWIRFALDNGTELSRHSWPEAQGQAAFALSGDGQRLAVLTAPNSAQVLATEDGSTVATLRWGMKAKASTTALALDATGKLLAVAGSTEPIQLLDVTQSKPPRSLPVRLGLRGELHFLDAMTLLVQTDHSSGVVAYDVTTLLPKVRLPALRGGLRNVAYRGKVTNGPSALFALAGDEGALALADPVEGTVQTRFTLNDTVAGLTFPRPSLREIATKPHRPWLAIRTESGAIRLWNTRALQEPEAERLGISGTVVLSATGLSTVRLVGFVPPNALHEEPYLSVGGYSLLDQARLPARSLKAPLGTGHGCLFGTGVIWPAKRAGLWWFIARPDGTWQSQHLQMSIPVNQTLVVGNQVWMQDAKGECYRGTPQAWETSVERFSLPLTPCWWATTPGGEVLLANDERVYLLDSVSLQIRREWAIDTPLLGPPVADNAGSRVAWVNARGIVIASTTSGATVEVPWKSTPTTRLVFGPEGQLLASAGNRIVVLDSATGVAWLKLPLPTQKPVQALRFDPLGKELFAVQEGRLHRWVSPTS